LRYKRDSHSTFHRLPCRAYDDMMTLVMKSLIYAG
jgi:hypothetical protein